MKVKHCCGNILSYYYRTAFIGIKIHSCRRSATLSFLSCTVTTECYDDKSSAQRENSNEESFLYCPFIDSTAVAIRALKTHLPNPVLVDCCVFALYVSSCCISSKISRCTLGMVPVPIEICRYLSFLLLIHYRYRLGSVLTQRASDSRVNIPVVTYDLLLRTASPAWELKGVMNHSIIFSSTDVKLHMVKLD